MTGTTTNSPTSIMARYGSLCKRMEQLYMGLPTPEDLSRMFAETSGNRSVSASELKPKPEPPCKLRSLAQQSVKPAVNSHQISNPQNRKDRITALPTEILEQILLNVDIRTVLLTAQRVSRFFRATIQNSKLLKRHLWLETREESEKPTILRGCPRHKIYETHLPLIPHGVCHLINYPSVRINPLLHKVLIARAAPRAMPSEDGMRKIKSLTKDIHELGIEGQKPSDEPIHVPINDLHIVFSTVKQITEWLEEADESPIPQIWPDMQLFTPNPFRNIEATVGYTAFEKMYDPSSKSKPPEHEGKWIHRVHWINAGTFDGEVTLRKLIERVKERHRDIYMQI